MSAQEQVENKKGAKPKKNIETKEISESENKNESQKKHKVKKKIKNCVPEDPNGVNIDTDLKQKKRKIKTKKVLSQTDATDNKQNGKKIKKEVAVGKNDQTLDISIKDENMEIKEETLHIKEEVINIKEENEEGAHPNETIDWPEKDLSELIKRIEAALPEKDNLAYSTRAEKLNWDDQISFNEYTGEACKRTWLLIQKRVRRFRLLSEVLQDAKEWISKPWTNFYRGNKTKRHPDMPRRPLSVYMIFYLKKKDQILIENPGMEMTEVSKKIAQMYKNISPAKRQKYLQMAAEERRSYEEKLEEFYRLHPEIPRYVEKPNHSKPVEVGPKKPSTPFALYFEEQLRIIPADSEVDRNALKEQCKEQWRNMSDKKKVVWIDWALDKEAKYQDELKNYISQNPDFVPVQLKPVLTKEEKTLKERLAGKPIKPPNSAYSLFSRMMLQSEEIKKIPPKDRMKAIADQWKDCTDKEKKQYRERANHLMEQYKLDFASYLESLPEEKRQEELQNNLPKRKVKTTSESEETPQKKKKSATTNSNENITENNADNNTPSNNTSNNNTPSKNEEDSIAKIFESEPAQPPVSGFALFSKRYHGKVPVEMAWKNLSKLEKKEYEAEVQKLKQKYIKEYEKFLKSLSKEQLTAFSQLKRKRERLNKAANNGGKSEESSNSCDSESENESSDAASD
ncbi:hypothetical protein ILUMI_21315 [Ignelater luminosus]|uniref:HMG box domain-containing protein n=1 Tax=Ignelater luminosus TaxID=2038154 RepID=A0A8K0CHY6_IGNLU|nr:hypothetical protein ILUMI_21315 [Ignelater luminosus]